MGQQQTETPISQPVGQKPSLGQGLLSNPDFPQWDIRKKRIVTRMWLYMLLGSVIVISVAGFCWAATQLVQPATVKAVSAENELTVVLVMVVGAAVGIERLLETIFNVIERNWLTLVAYMGHGLRWLQKAETEVENSRQWLSTVSLQYQRMLSDLPGSVSFDAITDGITIAPDQVIEMIDRRLQTAKKLMSLAEYRLAIAENELLRVTDHISYRVAKRAACAYISIFLGTTLALVGSLQMFALLGIRISNPRIDVFLTGIVIGGIVFPVHSVIVNFVDIVKHYIKK